MFSECTHCKKTLEETAFPPELKQQYQAQSQSVKRPLWHSIGCVGIVGIMGINLILGLGAMIWGATREPDAREEKLIGATNDFTASPTFEADSFSFKLKQKFDKMEANVLDPSTFEYYSTANDQKVLVLVKVPDLKEVKKENRVAISNIINKFLDTQAGLADKERYIGVHGRLNMMIVKTPTTEENGNIVASAPLKDFFGEETEKSK